jgi:hypothetical protein
MMSQRAGTRAHGRKLSWWNSVFPGGCRAAAANIRPPRWMIGRVTGPKGIQTERAACDSVPTRFQSRRSDESRGETVGASATSQISRFARCWLFVSASVTPARTRFRSVRPARPNAWFALLRGSCGVALCAVLTRRERASRDRDRSFTRERKFVLLFSSQTRASQHTTEQRPAPLSDPRRIWH